MKKEVKRKKKRKKKIIDFNVIEKKWQNYWEKEKIYRFDPKSKKKIFSIDVPPPYASSGHLHVGHALHYTQFEIIARFRRMLGENVYFAPCFDDNGLPTEKYVEEKLGISKKDVTRAKFRKLCLEESKKIEKTYSDRVFKKLGHSYDWSLLYTTISPEAQKIAQVSFLDLIKKGDCYRAEEPTIWCPYHQTALAQAEVEDLKRTTQLNYIYFDLEGEKEKIKIATTRPELLASCVGVFVNPSDIKNKKLVGKTAIVPLFGYKVRIMEDEKVDPEFGTGIVMVCTFGDTGDIEFWKKYKLDLKISIDKEGKLTEVAGKYKGLDIKRAKEKILEDLRKEKRLEKQETIEQTVGACWRCSTPIEFIVTKQWFIKTLQYKEKLIGFGRKIQWFPQFYRMRYEDWVRNLGWDWTISRQRYYGVPIPVWYCKKCKKIIFAEKNNLPVDPTASKPKKKCSCGSNQFKPEYDVFDTWMTSSMTPQIAMRWLKKPKEFKKMFPASLRPQAHDIIRTWTFYTILKSFLHFSSIPWKNIAIGTYVLDSKGKGMHKSKGNVIWAEDILNKYSTDVFRYWVGIATFGEDLRYQEKDLIAGKKFLTKLWNAFNFSSIHLKNYKSKKPKKLQAIDQWLLSKIQKLIQEITKDFKNYKTGNVTRKIEYFFWHIFCDNYLEISKNRLYQGKKQEKESAQYTLYNSFLTLIKILAPTVPHITEELYQQYYRKHEKVKSIHIAEWPKPVAGLINEKIEKLGDKAIEIIGKVRQYKTKNQKSLKAEIILTLDKDKIKELKPFIQDLAAVTKAKEIKTGKFDIKFL
ncbi:MAG: valine--tRNA ligase [Candidatus Pacearchaeota archaeon]|nr:MAG: valine--tRNA ligase [Candidatus Pacearchaeota archaeon]